MIFVTRGVASRNNCFCSANGSTEKGHKIQVATFDRSVKYCSLMASFRLLWNAYSSTRGTSSCSNWSLTTAAEACAAQSCLRTWSSMCEAISTRYCGFSKTMRASSGSFHGGFGGGARPTCQLAPRPTEACCPAKTLEPEQKVAYGGCQERDLINLFLTIFVLLFLRRHCMTIIHYRLIHHT